jgi:cytochrome c oxidase assembly protein subunit 11
MPAPKRGRHARVVLPLFGVLLAMAGLTYASVPLYRLFCQVTGYGGTTQRAVQAPGAVKGRVFTIRFNADVQPGLPWTFQPVRREVQVKLGEQTLAYFRAHNHGRTAITGTATFNVTPQKVGRYFDKIACFCFTRQRLEPGQTVDMPVTFYVDPEIVKDRNAGDVDTITLSYSFFPARTDTEKAAAAGKTD